jgi:RNA polymerase sigma-70 factor (ECF subfamily)
LPAFIFIILFEPFEALDSFRVAEPSIKSRPRRMGLRLGNDQTSTNTTERFYRLVWPQRAAVLRLARILTRNPGDADELAQDAMIKAFRAIDGFKEGTDIRAWLAAILRNARIDRLRAAGAHHTLSLDELPFEPVQAAPPRAGDVEWNEPEGILQSFSDQQMIDALGTLPEEIRWTLLLVDVEGLDQAEAGKILKVPVGTIKSRAHRGRAMLRESLLPVARERGLIRG